MRKPAVVSFALAALVLCAIPCFASEPSAALLASVNAIRGCAAADELQGGSAKAVYERIVRHCESEMNAAVMVMMAEADGGDIHVWRRIVGRTVQKMVIDDQGERSSAAPSGIGSIAACAAPLIRRGRAIDDNVQAIYYKITQACYSDIDAVVAEATGDRERLQVRNQIEVSLKKLIVGH